MNRLIILIVVLISGNVQALDINSFFKWSKEAGHIIVANSYFCPNEKFTRNVANYIRTHGSISKGTIRFSFKKP